MIRTIMSILLSCQNKYVTELKNRTTKAPPF